MSTPQSSPYRRTHRRRISAVRLSSDSTLTTLPAYTSPPWQKPVGLPAEEDKPPEYSDSAEDADADTDSDDDNLAVINAAQRRIYSPSSSSSYVPSTPPLTFSPSRRYPRSQGTLSRSSSRHSRRQHNQPSSSNDPYLDSLLARSVHALEMSNTLLQSSMSTQSSLSTVLASDSMADLTLEARAQNLSSRIKGNDRMKESWLDSLDQIYEDVEGLLAPEPESSVSQSLPTSSNMSRSRLRRPSVEFRNGPGNGSDASLSYSKHDRSALIAPPPRALTLYVDSTEDPSAITLPSTLGRRSTSHPLSTPLPPEMTCSTCSLSDPISSTPKAVEILGTLVRPGGKSKTRRSSTSSVGTTATFSVTTRKSPPVPIVTQRSPSKSASPEIRSRSLTRTDTPARFSQSTISLVTQSIEELSGSSGESSDSNTLHVDKTLESLRSILSKSKSRSPSATRSDRPPPARPSLLIPPTVEPVASTSTATASISRLFTKGRHSSSTRPPSPPRHSSLKVRSTPVSPTGPTPSGSLLNVRDAAAGGGLSRVSSGQSTPKKISFAELPESTSGNHSSRSSSRRTSSRLKSSSSRTRSKSTLPTSRSRLREEDKDDGEDPGGDANKSWLSSLLFGPTAGKGGGGLAGLSGPGVGTLTEERYGRLAGFSAPGWGGRPGFAAGVGGMEDWAV